jgi:hypothetical protein
MDGSAKTTVERAGATFAALLGRHCGDLVTGLHLVGSVADGDFRVGQSDLDFVAVLGQVPDASALRALATVHRKYVSDRTLPPLDGIWLTEDELRRGPDAVAHGPATAEGVLFERALGNRNPVTWVSLQRSVPVFGILDRASLWNDRVRLRSWVRENAETYWRRWYARAVGWGMPGLAMLGRSAPMWGVLGVARQHYTVVTGEIASKSAAGDWALETVGGRYRRILEESLAFRRGAPSLYSNPLHRRRDALAFVAVTIDAVVSA